MTEVFKSFTQEKFYVEYKVEKRFDHYRLDQFIQNYFPSFSRQFIKKKIERGEILIKGRAAQHRPSTKVHAGDVISFVTFKKEMEDEYWLGDKVVFEEPCIVYEDMNLLVVSKPPFMVTHPTGRHLFFCATTFYEGIYGHTIHSLHRLDRETSGLLLLGKNPKASNLVTSEFEANRVLKCYFFIAKKESHHPSVFPFWAKENLGRTEDLDNQEINEDGENRLSIKVYPEGSAEGKTAQTLFDCLHQEGDYLLGLAYPKTGRQHQIRAHAAHHGLPLLGDKLYLGDAHLFGRFKDRLADAEDHALVEIPRQALHSIGINFSYEKEYRSFFAPLPQDLKWWIESRLHLPIAQLEKDIQSRVENYFKTSRK